MVSLCTRMERLSNSHNRRMASKRDRVDEDGETDCFNQREEFI